MIFIDSSAFLAFVQVDDINHLVAKHQWMNLLNANETLYTNNYVAMKVWLLSKKDLARAF